MTTPHCWLRLVLLASLPFASAFGQNSSAPIDIPAGTDLLEASGLIHLELPEDFFAPGSSPYEGDVPAAGVRIETAGPFELGTTSLILERLTAITLPYPAMGPQRCIVELTGFSVSGTGPILVTVGGVTQKWSVTAQMPSGTTALATTTSLERTHLAALLRAPSRRRLNSYSRTVAARPRRFTWGPLYSMQPEEPGQPWKHHPPLV